MENSSVLTIASTQEADKVSAAKVNRSPEAQQQQEAHFANISFHVQRPQTIQRPQTQNSIQSRDGAVSHTRKMLREAQSHKSYQQAELA